MSMSHKDLTLIADVINMLVLDSEEHETDRLDTLTDVMVSVSNALRDEYPNFDPERFRRYIITGTLLDPEWRGEIAPNAGSAS